jgi:hypothetical protein
MHQDCPQRSAQRPTEHLGESLRQRDGLAKDRLDRVVPQHGLVKRRSLREHLRRSRRWSRRCRSIRACLELRAALCEHGHGSTLGVSERGSAAVERGCAGEMLNGIPVELAGGALRIRAAAVRLQRERSTQRVGGLPDEDAGAAAAGADAAHPPAGRLLGRILIGRKNLRSQNTIFVITIPVRIQPTTGDAAQ